MSIFPIGELLIGATTQFGNNLTAGNPFDTYTFSTPSLTSDNGAVGFDVAIDLLTLTNPVTLRLGQDQNGNGLFEIEEQIGGPLSISSSPRFFSIAPGAFLNEVGNYPGLLNPDSYFEPGESYFLVLDGAGTSVTYFGNATTGAAVGGEITADDAFYCCNDGERYYHDEFTTDLLGQEIRVGEGGLLAGQEVTVAVASPDFDPVLMIFNVDTGEVIEAAKSTLEFTNIDGITYRSAEINIFLQEDISYGVSVETLTANTTGTYGLTANL